MPVDRTPPLPQLVASRHALFMAIIIVGGVVVALATLVLGVWELLSADICVPVGTACYGFFVVLVRLSIPRAPLRRAKEYGGRVCTACAYPLLPVVEGEIRCSECGTIQDVAASTASWRHLLKSRGMLEGDPGRLETKSRGFFALDRSQVVAASLVLVVVSLVTVFRLLAMLMRTRGTSNKLLIPFLFVPGGVLIASIVAVVIAGRSTRRK